MQKKYFFLLLYVVSTALLLIGCQNTQKQAEAEATSTPAAAPAVTEPPSTQAEKTLIAPSLTEPIDSQRNLVWCATLQLAWNELTHLADGPVTLEKDIPLATVLNQQREMNPMLDDASYLARAGIVNSEFLKELEQSYQQKFPKQPFPSELQGLPQGTLLVYAYLKKALPFEWAFTRFPKPLNYQDTPVASFGLAQYMSGHPSDDNLAQQVSVLDYKSDDDFVLELFTTSAADRLILAKISPAATLQSTLVQVLGRIKQAQPTSLQKLETLMIPVIELDRTRRFPELCESKLHAPNQAVNGQSLSLVEQQIRFRLDETGAELESKAIFVSALPPRKLIFDKPFLLMLIRQDASMPYFVLWVNNADVLVSSQ